MTIVSVNDTLRRARFPKTGCVRRRCNGYASKRQKQSQYEVLPTAVSLYLGDRLTGDGFYGSKTRNVSLIGIIVISCL